MMKNDNKKYLIWGYYGFGNLGDELMLMNIVSRIKQKEPHAEITVACLEAPLDDRIVPFPIYGMNMPVPLLRALRQMFALLRLISRIDVYIVGGGTLFIDKGKHNRSLLMLAITVFYASLRRKKIYTIGVGIDVLTFPLNILYLRSILRNSNYACLRDDYSYTVASSLVDSNSISRGSDIIFDSAFIGRLTDRPCTPERKRHIVVSLTDYYKTWRIPGKRDRLLEKARDLIEHMIERHAEKYTILLCAFQKTMGESDYEFLNSLLRAIREKNSNYAEERLRLEYVETDHQIRKVFGSAVFTVGMRYHALVLSALFKKPFLGINMEMKIKEICIEFGMPFINIDDFLVGGIAPDDIDRLSGLGISEKILQNQTRLAEHNFTWMNEP